MTEKKDGLHTQGKSDQKEKQDKKKSEDKKKAWDIDYIP